MVQNDFDYSNIPSEDRAPGKAGEEMTRDGIQTEENPHYSVLAESTQQLSTTGLLLMDTMDLCQTQQEAGTQTECSDQARKYKLKLQSSSVCI